MLILVAGATADVRRTDPARVGLLLRPGARTAADLLAARPWAIDNAAYGGAFDPAAFLALLHRRRGVPRCLFAAAPDVVGDATATLALFTKWRPILRALEYPVALVAQDGLTVREVPWTRIDAIFIGGTTAWKLSRAVDDLLGYASALGKWRHIGRVNSLRRFRHFGGLADSLDGSGFSQWPKHIEGRALRWIRTMHREPRLDFTTG